MSNKVTGYKPQDAINAKAHRKEKGFDSEYCAIVQTREGLKAPVTLRIYWAGYTAYACLWVENVYNKKREYIGSTGSGKAQGYGYCKASAAAAYAIDKAGIKLQHAIDGRGMDAVRDAVEAIARHFYPKAKIYVHKANG